MDGPNPLAAGLSMLRARRVRRPRFSATSPAPRSDGLGVILAIVRERGVPALPGLLGDLGGYTIEQSRVNPDSLTRADALARLRRHREELTSLRVRSLALFGSVARDDAAPSSDVDLLVEFSAPVGLFEFLELKERLEQILGVNVDLVTRDALKSQLRDRILAEAVRAA